MEWVEKYKPSKWEEVLGNDQNLNILQNFFWAWSQDSPFANAILLAGEEGCGKTTVAEVAAIEHDFNLISLNASEKKDVQTYRDLRLTSGYESWDNESKCLLLDECDYLGGRFDSKQGGAWFEIEKIINAGKTPVVMCCNYSEGVPWRIRSNKHVTVLEMTSRSIPKQRIFDRLMKIAVAEGYEPNVKAVKQIVKVCPTIRSCIKTLQLCCENNNWRAIYPRDVDGSQTTRFMNLFHGNAKDLPTKETYRLMDYALANGVPLTQITQMNRLSLVRRSVPGFKVHEGFAFCMQNKKLQNVVRPTFFEKKSRKKETERRKREEEKKRKELLKRLDTEEKKPKAKKEKAKKQKPAPTPESSWEDLF